MCFITCLPQAGHKSPYVLFNKRPYRPPMGPPALLIRVKETYPILHICVLGPTGSTIQYPEGRDTALVTPIS